MGNRTAMARTAEDGTVAEWEKYEYNESNQLITESLFIDRFDGSTSRYLYDSKGNVTGVYILVMSVMDEE